MLDNAERYVELLSVVNEQLLYILVIELEKQGLIMVETKTNEDQLLPNLLLHHIEGTRAYWELMVHPKKNYEWVDKEFAPYGADLPAERYAEVINYAMELAGENPEVEFLLNIGYLEPSYAKTHLKAI